MKTRYVFAVCLILTAAVISKADSEETDYFAIFLDGKKIGHSVHSRVLADGKVTTTQDVSMKLRRDDTPITINTTMTYFETSDGQPLGFKFVQDLGKAVMTLSGTVDEFWGLNITASSMGREQKKSMVWPNDALLAEGLRLFHIEKGLKEGLEYTIKPFSPVSLKANEAKVRIGPKRNVDLMGRVVALTEVTTFIGVPGKSEVASVSYVDDDFRVLKSVASMMGMQIETIACTKEFAMSRDDTVELIDKMFLASPKKLDNIESAKSAVYRLKPTSQAAKLTIPSSDNQSVQGLEGGVITVTVKPIAAPVGASFPYKGDDSNILEAMKPTGFLQSDQSEIIGLAKSAIGDTKDAAEAVRRIEAFVNKYIKNRSLSVGYASAAEVAESKEGDCSEFAVLAAAMCRAVGIPARVVFGLVYAEDFLGKENMFGCHAWVEAYVGGKWVGLDATRGRGGFGPGHIALAVGNGEPIDFFGVISTLGYFSIEDVEVER